MTLPAATFYYLAIASTASALLAVTRTNAVHSLLWVLSLFLHVAGIFVLLAAEFLAAVQVIVYAGAILIFYLFVLMLLDIPGEESRSRFGRHWPFAAAAGLSVTGLAWLARSGTFASAASLAEATPRGGGAGGPPQGSLSEVGMALFGPFALPFEITSLILLAAIVGAIVLAKKRVIES